MNKLFTLTNLSRRTETRSVHLHQLACTRRRICILAHHPRDGERHANNRMDDVRSEADDESTRIIAKSSILDLFLDLACVFRIFLRRTATFSIILARARSSAPIYLKPAPMTPATRRTLSMHFHPRDGGAVIIEDEWRCGGWLGHC